MHFEEVDSTEIINFNKNLTHPLQSYEWGTFRENTGVKVIRRKYVDSGKILKSFTLTIHPIPRTPFTVGYLPKGYTPDKELLLELRKIGKINHSLFIQLEPNIPYAKETEVDLFKIGLKKAVRPLFTRYNFVLDLTQDEDTLLAGFHPKTRYNIKIAKRHNVSVVEKNSAEAFTEYLKLVNETTKRQGFYAHTPSYHKTQWNSLSHTAIPPYNSLSSHLLIANYNKKILTTWILFVFKDTLYYPYGASSSEHRDTMSSTLVMWEAIKFGRRLGLKKFDMWGALGSDPDPLDSWYGFHRFKQGFRPEHIELVGSFDLVINPILYPLYKLTDKLRWMYLKLK